MASDALLEVARSIQLCLIEVLNRHHLIEVAYHQHVADMEEELSEVSQRADAMQALVPPRPNGSLSTLSTWLT